MIALEATLIAESGGLRLGIEGRANALTCRVDGGAPHLWGALWRARQLLSLVRAVTPLLLRAGIRLEFAVGRFAIGRAGSGVVQNAAARLLRLPSVHLGA